MKYYFVIIIIIIIIIEILKLDNLKVRRPHVDVRF
jgi:hypothetical protein